ncbi:MAG: hypothetical protein HC938_01300 [Nitrospira sp.]|nr:hypothetical protein [Nitrospira sp.]
MNSDISDHQSSNGGSASYIPADKDTDFLQRDELRPIRIGLELLKPELIQREEGIQSTIVVFGSARLHEPSVAQQTLALAERRLLKPLTIVACNRGWRSPSAAVTCHIL